MQLTDSQTDRKTMIAHTPRPHPTTLAAKGFGCDTPVPSMSKIDETIVQMRQLVEERRKTVALAKKVAEEINK